MREMTILSILINGEKYGLQLRREFEKRAPKGLPLGSLYVTMDRMEEAGFVTSRVGESLAELGGNRRKYFKISAKGTRALNSAVALFRGAFDLGALHD